jgi:hypothetical protein
MTTGEEIRTQLGKLIKERQADLQSFAKLRKEEHDKLEENGKVYLREVTEELQNQHIDIGAIHKLGAKGKKLLKKK